MSNSDDDTGYTFRDRIVAMEVQVKYMRQEIQNETNMRATANGERRVELERLNSKIDMLNADRAKDNAALGEKLDRTNKIVYTMVGIGVAINTILAFVTAFKK